MKKDKMLLTKPQMAELVRFGRISDREIRSDLSLGLIVTENDYTSNFTGAFRRNVNCYSRTGLSARSFLLTPQLERAGGIDATIIISDKTSSKIMFFEAKWPRFKLANYKWDYAQTAPGLSHFSDQLDRQSQLSPAYPVFEMFYVEFPFRKQPAFLLDQYSSCVWHDDAIAFRSGRSGPMSVWTQKDCEDLIKNASCDIGVILESVAACRRGQPINSNKPEEIIRELHLEGNILAISGGRPEGVEPATLQ